ncbi:Acetyl xylan esterase (AXE1) [Abditibacterium utsteinense]|uniref:Acetyl xylan esterase (AXE1) n=1 Tax=Abditibacterium utsteinense TaxID=1960156 RepID=A0A2S8SVB2_9BACT|nr:acetylxylan esterase [Abditibacterium utsteinense]PQV64726.1 Acetyl xylan esterase (AXE1) [Abditibacterium utsteinense]
MLGLYEWAVTVRVLYNLAKFYPELTRATAPLQTIPEELQLLAARGNWEIRVENQTHCRLTYPIEAKNGPAILFSGGGGDDGAGYETLVQHWASHGFTVLQPVHFDSYTHHHAATGSVFWGHQKTTWDVWGLVLGEKRLWRARCQDIKRLLDEIGDFKGRIDISRIGIGGYSYGAHVALLMGGAEMRTRQGRFAWTENRAKAIVNLSGEAGTLRQPKGVLQSLRVPTLFVTGDGDKSVWGRDVDAKLDAFRRAPHHLKELLDIRGATHFAFAGRLWEEAKHPADKAAQAAIFGTVLGATTKFWLKNL